MLCFYHIYMYGYVDSTFTLDEPWNIIIKEFLTAVCTSIQSDSQL